MKFRILLILLLTVFAASVYAQTEEPELMQFDSEKISFSYDPTLASEVMVEEVPEVPFEEGMPYWGPGPAYTKVNFVDYAGGEQEFFHQPAIYLYPTEPMPEFGDEEYTLQGQFDSLNALLDEEADLAEYSTTPTTSGEMNLPFLPLFNAAQVFRAQPEYIEFQNGRGIRYLSYYSQAVNPITNAEIFYTFQGITDDGKFYVSAVLPVNTGVFEDEYPGPDFDYDEFAANYETYLEESVTALNELPADATTPTLEQLDSLIMSMTVGE